MKVIVADGQRFVREGTVCLLRSLMPGIIVEGVGTGVDAVSLYTDRKPQLVITEMMLPDFSGLELCRRIRERWRRANILFLADLDDVDVVRHALESGAMGYVSKQCRPSELLAAFRQISEGETYLEHRLATRLALGQSEAVSHRIREITPRELEILMMIAKGQSNEGISARLNISAKTVANHIALLKNKLQISTPFELLHFAVEAGLASYGRAGSKPALDTHSARYQSVGQPVQPSM
ncbi:response regulator transcription factor [Marinobacter litoralis]|uniref:response regulator transcription factor n=1 Tax=Marinobacter litoralis TaxID=187981 RepID=UPI0018EDD360|nr:response regulator transcription factor [Marinobacter litoralis]MBJ6136801.1 response regulator transcription factor [Marinobacter litoralis]